MVALLGAPVTSAVWTWGSNSAGQLGLGPGMGNQSSPQAVTFSSANFTAAAVAAGKYHTIVVGTGGLVLAWGLNDTGQLGDSTNVDKDEPQTVLAPY